MMMNGMELGMGSRGQELQLELASFQYFVIHEDQWTGFCSRYGI
jgi:hypothetical protein